MRVTCNGLQATFLTASQMMQLDDGSVITPPELERRAGKATAKRWKRSVRELLPDGSVGEPMLHWLSRHGLQEAPCARQSQRAAPGADVKQGGQQASCSGSSAGVRQQRAEEADAAISEQQGDQAIGGRAVMRRAGWGEGKEEVLAEAEEWGELAPSPEVGDVGPTSAPGISFGGSVPAAPWSEGQQGGSSAWGCMYDDACRGLQQGQQQGQAGGASACGDIISDQHRQAGGSAAELQAAPQQRNELRDVAAGGAGKQDQGKQQADATEAVRAQRRPSKGRQVLQ